MSAISNHELNWDEFQKVDMRIGTIIEAEIFQEARVPAYKLLIDFGPLGTRKSSAQITKLYQPEDLIGKQVVAIVNFPPKQIANIKSQCLVLGSMGDENTITLIQPERNASNGLKIG
jgi:tRNA-binding protein